MINISISEQKLIFLALSNVSTVYTSKEELIEAVCEEIAKLTKRKVYNLLCNWESNFEPLKKVFGEFYNRNGNTTHFALRHILAIQCDETIVLININVVKKISGEIVPSFIIRSVNGEYDFESNVELVKTYIKD